MVKRHSPVYTGERNPERQPEIIMLLRDISWMASLPVAVTSATIFLCTENVFPHPLYYWALYL
ncbi:MAG: hypothetical protein ACI8WM_001320 [Burkholderiaceae bacterium]|jgi:hypothetical protein